MIVQKKKVGENEERNKRVSLKLLACHIFYFAETYGGGLIGKSLPFFYL